MNSPRVFLTLLIISMKAREKQKGRSIGSEEVATASLNSASRRTNSSAGLQFQSVPLETHQDQVLATKPQITFVEQGSTMLSLKRARKGEPYRNFNSYKNPTSQQKHLEINQRSQNRTSHTKIKNFVKMAALLSLFYEKLTCNSTLRKPVSFDPLQSEDTEDQGKFIFQLPRVIVPELAQNILTVTQIVYIIIYLFTFPLSLLFKEVSQSEVMILVKSLGVVLCLLDIFDLVQVPISAHPSNYSPANQIKTLIAKQRNELLVQLLILISTILSLILTEKDLSYSSVIFVFMLINIKKYQEDSLKKLQSQFFIATLYQKYWDIVKMMAMNIFVCHLLACVLICMTHFEGQENWMTKNNIFFAPWYEKYIWSYYFGITIILTIGFGDLHATNYIEAFVIITISFFAVVFFGYNINYIGNRINSIREDEMEKNGKLKIFGTLAKKTQVPKELKTEITNYIVEECEIKKISNLAQEKKLLQELPSTLRSSFLQEANKQLFTNLLSLVSFSKKTIETLSEAIEMKICHPEQIIKKANSAPQLMIIQSGEVGFVTRIRGGPFKINGIVIDRIANNLENRSKPICVDVFSSNPVNYDIKSLSYSVIYYMSKDTFEKSLRAYPDDFQSYRELKDRCQYKMNKFGLTLCRFCPNKKHTLFDCPRLHFTPFRNTIPALYYRTEPMQKQQRQFAERNKEKSHFEFVVNREPDQSESIDFDELCKIKPQIFRQKRVGKLDMQANFGHQSPGKKKSSSARASYVQRVQFINQIRDEFKRMRLEGQNAAQFQFSLWMNEVDEAHNFNTYFPRNNPNRLLEKYTKASLKNLGRSRKKRVSRCLMGTDSDSLHMNY